MNHRLMGETKMVSQYDIQGAKLPREDAKTPLSARRRQEAKLSLLVTLPM
jgi:hypothetical protein